MLGPTLHQLAHMRHRTRRRFELALGLLVAAVIAAAIVLTWSDVELDRRRTLATNEQVASAIAELLEHHVAAALRDSTNAADSAAVLIEQQAAAGDERRLHEELHRELLDETSTARLVLTAPDGRVLASSVEFPSQVERIEEPGQSWPIEAASGRVFHIAQPRRSPYDGELVLPYFTRLHASDGRPLGTLIAEIRVAYFDRAWRSVESLPHAAVTLATSDGWGLLRYPLRPDYLSGPSKNAREFIERFVKGRKGNAEFTGQDGVRRFYAWRQLLIKPLVVAVGMDKDSVLAPWRTRALLRSTMVAAGCVLLVAAAVVLARYLRRLEESRDELRDAEARYVAAMESSHAAVSVWDAQGRKVYVNPGACAITGYTREQLMAMPMAGILLPEEEALRRKALKRLFDGEVPSVTFEGRITHRDGSERWLLIHAELLPAPAGAPRHAILHSYEITQTKHAEAQVRALNRELEKRVEERTSQLSRANEELEAFTYSAAHDIRGPLVTLGLFVERLPHDLGEVPVKAARRLENMSRQVTAMMQTVEDLLALSRSSHVPLRASVVDMFGLAGEVCEQLDLQAGDRRLTWRIQPMPEVWVDRGAMREALTNLLGNALKYTRGCDWASIEIGCEHAGDGMAEFYVADNGAGFDPQKAAALFRPFSRLHSAPEFEGTGVGLAIVQRLIERSGGRIWARARREGGAVFRFTLPLAQPARDPGFETA